MGACGRDGKTNNGGTHQVNGNWTNMEGYKCGSLSPKSYYVMLGIYTPLHPWKYSLYYYRELSNVCGIHLFSRGYIYVFYFTRGEK